jgi:hypothetical protein
MQAAECLKRRRRPPNIGFGPENGLASHSVVFESKCNHRYSICTRSLGCASPAIFASVFASAFMLNLHNLHNENAAFFSVRCFASMTCN